ncbi:MAG: aminoglycoside phosphotransferase family protein [Candidatus Sericytochromatia bacterium]
MLLPEASTPESYAPLFQQDALWLPALAEICRRHGLNSHLLTRFREGSAIVFGTEDVVIKLLPPFWQEELMHDVSGLRLVAGQLPLAVPEIKACETLENWFYLILSRVPGVQIKTIWRQLGLSEQTRLLGDLGRLLSQFHALSAPTLPGNWPEFLRAQTAQFSQQQARNGLATKQIRLYQQRLEQGLKYLPAGPSVPLHSDLTGDHLLLSKSSGSWEFSGLLDFGDLMTGWWGYEMVAPSLCFTEHQPTLRAALFEGYGQALNAQDLLTLVLLHRFTHVPFLLRQVGLPADAPPEALASVYCQLP